MADKKHNNKKPTKKDDKAPVDPKPEKEKTPVKPHPKPTPKPDHTNSTSTESFEPSKDGARDKPKNTDANTSTDAHEAKKKKDVAEKEKKDPKADKKAANHEKFAKIDKHFDPNTMPFNEGQFGIEQYEGGLRHYKPNLKLRVTENMAELMQEELLIFLQTYYNFDYGWPDKG